MFKMFKMFKKSKVESELVKKIQALEKRLELVEEVVSIINGKVNLPSNLNNIYFNRDASARVRTKQIDKACEKARLEEICKPTCSKERF